MLPANSLRDRVALITGGGTGIGKAMAQRFCQLGARVVIASRKKEVLDQAAAEMTAQGGDVLAVPTDVREVAQVQRLVARTQEHFGGVDILVNNAAGNFIAKALDLSPNGWNAIVGIVLNGTWFCSQAAAKAMVAQGRGGNILNIIATYAWTGGPGTVPSAAAKAAVLNLTQSLAVEWAPHRIRVNAIAPGPIATENTTRQLFGSGALIDAMTQQIPLGRFGTVEEIADAAAYLVSDYAGYITGANLTIDGGGWLNKGFLRYLDRLPPRQG